MNQLELKIPPPIIAVLCAICMWGTEKIDLLKLYGQFAKSLAIIFVAVGLCCAILGVVQFHLKRTTVNPHKPQNSSVLITHGIYKFSRNPMYLGMLCVLIAWHFWLTSPLSLIIVLVFVIYMNQFQIKPEEVMLDKLFGDAYQQYIAQTRRWI